MCGSDKYSLPQYKFSNAHGLNLEELFEPNEPEKEFGTLTPEDSRLFDLNVTSPKQRKPEPKSEETREELIAKIRLARQQRRNNEEVVDKKVSPTVNAKPLWKCPAKDLGRNVNKDKRTQNYEYSRRE